MIIRNSPEGITAMKHFIAVWQNANTIDDVTLNCGIEKLKAYRYRRELDVRLGIRLKNLERQRAPKLSHAVIAVLKQHADDELLRYINTNPPPPS